MLNTSSKESLQKTNTSGRHNNDRNMPEKLLKSLLREQKKVIHPGENRTKYTQTWADDSEAHAPIVGSQLVKYTVVDSMVPLKERYA